MIKEAINKILELKEHTSTDVTVNEYGRYTERKLDCKFDKANGNYKTHTADRLTRDVSTIKSLSAAVIEEAKRRENMTGQNMTVLFTQKGGAFYLDDDFPAGEYKFERTLSQQFKTLQRLAGKKLNHEEFLTFIQELSPSIDNFKKLYRSFLKVRIIGNSELSSNPVFVDNEAESGYKVKFTLEGGQPDEDIIPQGFICNLPYTKGAETKYEIPVETMILNNGDNELQIKILCPLLEQIEEKAIFDEVEQFRGDTKGLKDLLILESY